MRMKLVATVAAGVAVALTAAACGGGGSDSLTLEEYFDEIEALDKRFNEDSDALDAAFNSDDLDEIKGAFEDGAANVEEFVNELDSIDPPDEVQEAHDEAVSAGGELVTAFKAMSDDVQNVESVDDLVSLNTDDAAAASERFTAACFDIQQVATDNEIEVTLSCG